MLANNPPVILTQPYYECNNNWQTSLLNAVGISYGNTSAIVPMIILILLPLIYFYLQSIGYSPPIEEYTKEEKENALEEVAIQLMRVSLIIFHRRLIQVKKLIMI